MTHFYFGNQHIRFQAPECLERYTMIKEWDNGYIVELQGILLVNWGFFRLSM